MLRRLLAPARFGQRLLDRMEFVLDHSRIAVSRRAVWVRRLAGAGMIGFAVSQVMAGGAQVMVGVLVALVALIVLAGKIGLFARDWAPVGLMMAIYGSAFAAAAELGMPTWYSPALDADRAIGFGTLPGVWLQQHLHAATNDPLAVVAALGYASHYYVPVLLGLYLWWWHRDNGFFELMYTYVTVLFLAAVVFVLAPTAPPWLAHERGMIPPLHDVIKMGLLDLRLDTLADHKGDASFYLTRAAFPSIHAAWPTISLLVVVRHRMPLWVKGVVVTQLAAVWFVIVYAGEHYVTDILGGVLFALAASWLVRRYGAAVAEAMRPANVVELGRGAAAPADERRAA